MSYQRLPYDDAATTTEMASDCAAVGRRLPLPAARVVSVDQPQPTHGVVVPDEVAELAAGLQLPGADSHD